MAGANIGSTMKGANSEDAAEHYSSIPVAELVPVLDASKTEPERNMPEHAANNDAHEAF